MKPSFPLLRRILISLALLSFSRPNSVQAEGVPFKVGASLALTGTFAEYGVSVRNGIQLYLRDHPEYGSQVQFLFEDDGYDPKLTISAFNKLVDRDHINLFFVWGNEPALALAPVAERKHFPAVVVAQHPKAGAGYKYVIRFTNPAQDYSQAILEYLRKKGFKKFGVVQSEISFFNILLEEFKKNLQSGEELQILDSFPPAEMDFRSSLAKLRTKQFDALGVYLVPPQVSQFFRQAAEQKLSWAAFGATPFESRAVITQALGYMNGAVFSHMRVSEDFRRHYAQSFSDDIQVSYAANAYEFARITCELFGGLDKVPSAEEILAKYAAVPEGRGVAGHYRFKDSPEFGRYFEFEIAVKRIVDNQIVVLPPADY